MISRKAHTEGKKTFVKRITIVERQERNVKYQFHNAAKSECSGGIFLQPGDKNTAAHCGRP